MLDLSIDPQAPGYLWLGEDVTNSEVDSLLDSYKNRGYEIRCNHAEGYEYSEKYRFLRNHIWYLTKGDGCWMFAYHYGRAQWFVVKQNS